MSVRLSVHSLPLTMRLQISILFVLATTSFAYFYNPLDLFDRYQQTFQLNFDGYEKFIEKRENFLLNLKKIDAHNSLFNTGRSRFRMGINKFTHYSRKEVARYLTGLEPKADRDKWEFATEHRNSFGRGFRAPEKFDWNEEGKVTPVQDQGDCGSCYVFSAIASIESHMMIKFGNTTKLSEQEAMECTRGCAGGHPDMIFIYSRIAQGCTSLEGYPYEAEVENYCFKARKRDRVDHSRSMKFKHVADVEEDIIYYLVHKGPMATGMAVYQNFLMYTGGIYDTTGEDEEIVGYHAVLLVGYGEEDGTKYWTLKNSWSDEWGEKGYFRILRGEDLSEIESNTISYPMLENAPK